MENFALRVDLETPVIVREGWLTLDAILAALLFRETNDLETAHQDIPLDRRAGVWCGSAAFFVGGEIAETTCRFARSLKLDDLEFGEYLPPRPRSGHPNWIDQARNQDAHQWRAMLDLYPSIHAHEAWWFGRGDVSRIEKMMPDLCAIGSRVNHGWGKINSFEIEVIDEDLSLMFDTEHPARPVPLDAWKAIGGSEKASLRHERILPPYWRGDKVVCAVPETREKR